ncbi:hypothetical protein AnigIFM56816_006765 [Aspergillus niger]|nr:hypothetical protein AnigIFM56816_006765 [Aspergillus niger]
MLQRDISQQFHIKPGFHLHHWWFMERVSPVAKPPLLLISRGCLLSPRAPVTVTYKGETVTFANVLAAPATKDPVLLRWDVPVLQQVGIAEWASAQLGDLPAAGWFTGLSASAPVVLPGLPSPGQGSSPINQ